jgi:predicted ATPase
MLLVLDNCEHLIEGCAVLDDALLRACPGLEILAISRAPLRIAGESSWVVPSLSLPDPRRCSLPGSWHATRRSTTSQSERDRAIRHYEELMELLDERLGTAPAPRPARSTNACAPAKKFRAFCW